MSFQRSAAVVAVLLSWVTVAFAADPTADPAADNGPRRLAVGFNLKSILAIQEPEESFTAVAYLHLRWHEPALVGKVDTRTVLLGDTAIDRANEMGWPGIGFVDETVAAEVKHAVLTLLPDGSVDFDREYDVTIRNALDLHSFPFDRQVLKIDLESFAFPADELLLEADPEHIKLGRLGLPQWEIGELRWSTAFVEDEVEHAKYHRLSITLEMKRKPGFYVWQVFVPLFILIMIACTVFFLPSEDLADRISVITTSLLTAVALSYSVHTDLPKISYLTTVDRLFVTAYVFLGAKIMGMLIIRHLVDRREALAVKIDRIARWIFPTAYLSTNTIIILLSVARA